MSIHRMPPRKGNRAIAPYVTEDMGALSVRGYCMGAIRDGWWVYIEDHQSRPHDGLIDELCVAQLKDGRCLVRFLKKGRKPGTWDLVAVTGDPILDAELEWAEKVEWIRPHRPSDAELAFLEPLNSHGEYIGRGASARK